MQRPHRRAHARIWFVLMALLPAIIVAALLIRQNGPTDAPAVRLSPPSAAP
jgi:hypothetical protein